MIPSDLNKKNNTFNHRGGGHGTIPGPSLGTCAGYKGNIKPCPADKAVGLECSGLIRDAIYRGNGIDLGSGSAASQFKNRRIQPIDYADRQPGDIEFFHSTKGKKPINHVILYTGKNSAGKDMMIEAKETGTNVHEVPLRIGGNWTRFR